MQGAAILARCDFAVGLLRARECVILRQRDNRPDLSVQSLNTIQVNVCESFGS
jgi:hypothetical protein